MNIALDFDDTYTRSPAMWNKIVQTFLDNGHTVYCVTWRYPEEMNIVFETIGKFIGEENCIPTSRMSKLNRMSKERKIRIDIWIDDNPASIISDMKKVDIVI